MIAHHHPGLMTLSVLLACFASFVALELAGRVTISRGTARIVWLLGGAIAMGLGIWSMHFTAMLAYHLPVPVYYHLPVWLLSIAIAVVISLFALYVVSRQTVPLPSLLIASLAMGGAIAGMHYTGMAAMWVPAELHYDPLLVIASVAVALIAAVISLRLLLHFRCRRSQALWGKIASAVVMGVAIAGLHYTAMEAVSYTLVTPPPTQPSGPMLSAAWLAPGAVAGAGIVLGIALAAALVDRRMRFTRAQLEANRQRVAAMEASIDGIAVFDAEGRFVHLNEAHARIYGYDSPAELIGQSWSVLYGKAEMRRFGQEIAPEFARTGRWRGDGMGRRRDGTLFPQEVSLAAIEGGGYVCVVRDISERHASAVLNQQLAAIVMASDDAITSSIPDGTIVSWNPAAERMFGYTAEQMIGSNVARLVPPERAGEEQEILERVLTGEGVDHYETVRVRADGTRIDIALTVSPIRSADGDVVSTAAISRDITSQKRAQAELEQREERFRGLIENAVDQITLLDESARIVYVSPASRRLGWEPAELIGQSVFDYVHPDESDRVAEVFAESIGAPDSTMMVECRVRRRDGSWSLMESSGWNALHNPAIGAVVVNSRDVTYRHQLEERLREAHKMEAVGRFAGGIAHDFNNLLMIVKGHLELLQAKLPQHTDVRADLDEITRAADRAAWLTQQLLAFSRKQVLQLQILDLNALLRELDRIVHRLIGPEVELLAEPEPELWLTRADRIQMEQVLINLVVNARDAMPSGGVVTIRTENVNLSAADAAALPTLIPPGSYVRLGISDTGTGMDEETRAQIFDPFFTTKQRGKGRGLGLPTVYGIVKQSGGHIVVDTARDAGSTISIYLPRVTGPLASRESGGGAAESPDSATILLVEDEPAVRNLVQRALLRAGYAVIEAATAEEALHISASRLEDIDIIVSDVVLPQMSGPEMVDQLRQERPDVPVIFISGYVDEALRADEFSGSTYFLAKPFAPTVLIQQVRDALEATSRPRG